MTLFAEAEDCSLLFENIANEIRFRMCEFQKEREVSLSFRNEIAGEASQGLLYGRGDV